MRITAANAKALADEAIRHIPEPPSFAGTGIVICGGGIKYLTNAWVCINMLRHLGCALPIQLWHRDASEADAHFVDLIRPLGVEMVSATDHQLDHSEPLTGWQLKPFAILRSPFRNVILLDADNVPVINPEFLVETEEYERTGAIFWPDYGSLDPDNPIWSICGVDYISEPAFESGQIVVDKLKCWHSLNLAMWYNQHWEFYYQFIHGDKDTFHMAFRRMQQPFSMTAHPIHRLQGTMCQHDFDGRRIFQHRNGSKWTLFGENSAVQGFHFENLCLQLLTELKGKWRFTLKVPKFNRPAKSQSEVRIAEQLMGGRYFYEMLGQGYKIIDFNQNGMIGTGRGGGEIFWDIRNADGTTRLEVSSEDAVTSLLTYNFREDRWTGIGRWLHCGQCAVSLEHCGNRTAPHG